MAKVSGRTPRLHHPFPANLASFWRATKHFGSQIETNLCRFLHHNHIFLYRTSLPQRNRNGANDKYESGSTGKDVPSFLIFILSACSKCGPRKKMGQSNWTCWPCYAPQSPIPHGNYMRICADFDSGAGQWGSRLNTIRSTSCRLNDSYPPHSFLA